MTNIGIIVGREFNERVRKKSFIITTILMPLLVVAIGRGMDHIELTEISADDDHRYYRREGTHYVPKVALDELIIK